MSKISIRFLLVRDEDIFDDREVRAVGDEQMATRWFSVPDYVAMDAVSCRIRGRTASTTR